jgi:hypothetical protein
MVKALAVILMVACSHNDPKPTQPVARTSDPAPSDPAQAEAVTCEAVAARALKFDRTPDGKTAAELMTRHCRDDGWSPEYRRCIVTSNTWDEAVGCESKLSRAQLDELSKDAEAHGFTVARQPPKL